MAVSDAYVFPKTSTNATFLSKATDYFSHMLLQRWEAKIRRKEVASTGDRTQNHQVMIPTRSPLSHQGVARDLKEEKKDVTIFVVEKTMLGPHFLLFLQYCH